MAERQKSKWELHQQRQTIWEPTLHVSIYATAAQPPELIALNVTTLFPLILTKHMQLSKDCRDRTYYSSLCTWFTLVSTTPNHRKPFQLWSIIYEVRDYEVFHSPGFFSSQPRSPLGCSAAPRPGCRCTVAREATHNRDDTLLHKHMPTFILLTWTRQLSSLTGYLIN